MSVIDELLSHNQQFQTTGPELPTAPASRLAILTCMDSRLDVFGALGLDLGQAHVLRNAGGLPTPDALRSLAISQRLLGTSSIMVIQHTRCGMHNFDDLEFRNTLYEASGEAPTWNTPGFSDLDDNIRESVRRIIDCPWLPHRDTVRGFAFDVATSKLREVT